MPGFLLDIDMHFLDQRFWGEKVSNYLLFAGIIIATHLLKKPIAGLLSRVSSRVAARYSYMRHKLAVRNMLFKPMERLLQTILYYIAIYQLTNILNLVTFHYSLGQKEKVRVGLDDIVDHVFLFLFIIFLTQVAARFADFFYYLRSGKAQIENDKSKLQLLPLINEVTKLLLWVLSAFWIMGSVFQVNVPALITGLGIGGVAIALAGKETVENFFAAFTILSDKPFQTGETIRIGDIEGIVERIGFRSTRLRNADGSAYVIPNQNLVSQNLINLSNRETWGMKVVANIRYGISHDDLQQLMAKIKDELLHTPPVQAPVDVTIDTLDKETFKMSVSYYVPNPLPEGQDLVAVKQMINLKVFELISKKAILGAALGTS